MRSHRLHLDGIATHYLEAGSGTPVVLLHSGEYGASAELSWESNIDALADSYRVIAPDWLGFGLSDKVYDFGGQRRRMVQHMWRFLEAVGVEYAHFIGSSMGGSMLLEEAAHELSSRLIRSVITSSGGGFVPFNDARRQLLDYDCTRESMARSVSILFKDRRWADDTAYVTRRWESSLLPGAWECASAARLRRPGTEPRTDFGRPDKTAYEAISMPVLLVAGAEDPLREPGYAGEVAKRIPNGTAVVFEGCAHMPHIEDASRFNELVLDFLLRH